MLDVGLDIGARLVDVLEDGHFLLHDFDALLATRVVLEDQLLFLLQDLLDYSLVVLSELLDVVRILDADFIEGGDAVS